MNTTPHATMAADSPSPSTLPTQRVRRPKARVLIALTALGVMALGGTASANGVDAGLMTSAESSDVEVLDIECAPRRASIGCRWTAPVDPAAEAIVLVRTTTAGDGDRTVVLRSSMTSLTTAVDREVRPGVRYGYRVMALDARGDVVASSRRSITGVRPPDAPASVEILRLDCGLGDAAARQVVGCEWSLPTGDRAAAVSLWRSVDGAARELVASFPAPFPTSYRDRVPDRATRVVYAVLAHAADRTIVARSPPDGVVIPGPQRPGVTSTSVAESVELGRPIDTSPMLPGSEVGRPTTTSTQSNDRAIVPDRPAVTTTTTIVDRSSDLDRAAPEPGPLADPVTSEPERRHDADTTVPAARPAGPTTDRGGRGR